MNKTAEAVVECSRIFNNHPDESGCSLKVVIEQTPEFILVTNGKANQSKEEIAEAVMRCLSHLSLPP